MRRGLATLLALLTVACGGIAAQPAPLNTASTVRLGYLGNLTHAPALLAESHGFLRQTLSVPVRTEVFNAGPDAVQALFGGALDAAFMGPSPAINAFVKSHGEAVRIVAGATDGGAALVVRPQAGIASPADLKGKKLATPELGNTQDVALRSYLAAHNLKTAPQGEGDVKIVTTGNSTIFQLFKQGQIDGAWVPEPWESRLVDEAGGRVFVDEGALWPGGVFPTTLLVVATAFLRSNSALVRGLIEATVQAIDWIDQNSSLARDEAAADLARLNQQPLASTVLADAWSHLTFTPDPAATALATEARNARSVGLLPATASVRGILDLTLLDQVLAAQHT